MADPWIKMRTSLGACPQVVRIACGLATDEKRTSVRIATAVGLLHATWSLADAHTEDGLLPGYTAEALDALVGYEGWTELLKLVGWATVDGAGVRLERFEEHNGRSAKRRAGEAKRKQDVRNSSASDADRKRTREDKIREESKETPSESPTRAKRAKRARVTREEVIEIAKLQGCDDVGLRAIVDWYDERAAKGKPLTGKAWNLLALEAASDPATFAERVKFTTKKGWQGLAEASDLPAKGQSPKGLTGRAAVQKSNDEAAKRFVEQSTGKEWRPPWEQDPAKPRLLDSGGAA